MNHSKSQELMTRAERLMPGGVNSPVRAYKAVGGSPPFIARASGRSLFDVDGNEYLDYVGSWGPAILGHADPDVVTAVRAAAGAGLSFGAPTEAEVELAEAITARLPSIEMLRCVSSGTEATMSALRVARGFTERDCIVKFDGAYHGHSDALLVKAGSGAATFGSPDSGGVPRSMVEKTFTLRYNHVDELKRLFSERARDVAAVIVEPVAGNMGCVPPEPGFLESILRLCAEAGAVSIFDEVMTGFRLSPGGAQTRFALVPDLTCLGKVVGGGMPLAAYGGKREIMEKVSPIGPVYQAGTLSGNPLSVRAGLATLAKLDHAAYARLEALAERLEEGIRGVIREAAVTACVQRVGSMITLFFHPGPIRSWNEARDCDTERFGRWHRALLERGVYWPAAQFEAAFLSLAHSEADVDRTVSAIGEALRESQTR